MENSLEHRRPLRDIRGYRDLYWASASPNRDAMLYRSFRREPRRHGFKRGLHLRDTVHSPCPKHGSPPRSGPAAASPKGGPTPGTPKVQRRLDLRPKNTPSSRVDGLCCYLAMVCWSICSLYAIVHKPGIGFAVVVVSSLHPSLHILGPSSDI